MRIESDFGLKPRYKPLSILLKTVETSFLGEEGVMAAYALRMSDIIRGYVDF